MKRENLKSFVIDALRALDGSGSIVEVAQEIWRVHEGELRVSRDLFFTWQYDIRRAKAALVKEGKVRAYRDGQKSVWELI